ncbi:MAG: tRNA pseudouridine(38-40) synthase TruA [Mangrovibacterium sp.]
MKQRYFIELAYKGTVFHGWQIQPNAMSVQKSLEYTIGTICREPVSVTGAGRTDAGVHASYYVAHFESEQDGLDRPDFLRRLNRFLQADVAVYRIAKVDPKTHARFSAVLRTYCYFIHQQKDPFLQTLSWFFPAALDVERMNAAGKHLLGRHDFTSFSKLHTDVKTNFCTLREVVWKQEGHRLVFRITADRFLRNMVRALVGTMVMVGQGKIGVDDFLLIMEKKDRGMAGTSAPPEGLYLTGIRYPEELFRRTAPEQFSLFPVD